jgi:hypothetical protein
MFVVSVMAQEATQIFICHYVNMIYNYYIAINYDEVIDIFCKTSQHIQCLKLNQC